MRFRPLPTPALLLLGALASAALPACSVIEAPRTLRGNKVDDDQLKELVVGTSTKTDVTSLLGSPTAKATFNDNQWLYITEVTKVRVGLLPGIEHQSVVVLNFDPGGVLRGVQRRGQDDAYDVAMSRGATPSPGSEASFLQQLLGNIGKFNAGGGSGSSTSPSGGIGNSGAGL